MCFLIRRPCPRPSASSHGVDTSSSSSARTNNSSSSISLSSVGSSKELLFESGPIVFSFPEICASTSNFSTAHRIGRFAWNGVLRSSPVTVVKNEGIYTLSFLRHLHFLHHANIVPLVGTCTNGHNVYFVYPSFEATSLRDYLHGKLKGSCAPVLSWQFRMQIALDIAKGLEYLHHLSFIPIVHRHIESSSILISHKMRAKIANIGSAQPTADTAQHFDMHLQETEKKRSESFRIHGIQGYMPPEYAVTARNESIKYDVFSFGVLLAEILSGREAVCSFEHEKASFLSDELRDLLKEPKNAINKLRLWMDPYLQGSYPIDESHQVAQLAALCVDPDPQSRPAMSYVTNKLQMHFLASQSDQIWL